MNETDPTDRPFLEVPPSTVSPPFNLFPLMGFPRVSLFPLLSFFLAVQTLCMRVIVSWPHYSKETRKRFDTSKGGFFYIL